MAEAIAVLKQQGASSSIRPTSRASSRRTPNDSFPLWDFCSGAEHAKGKDAELLDQLQVRHEARLTTRGWRRSDRRRR